MSTSTQAQTPAEQPTTAEIKRGDRAMTRSIVFSATRCTIQYVLLPFVLPLFGLANSIGAAISLVLSGIALATVWYNVKDLWHTSWRYRYLGMAAVMSAIIALFVVLDIRALAQ
jgi:hypothetical protein